MVHLILKNQIKPDHIESLATNKSVYGPLSKLVLWDRLQFDQTKVLITAIKNGDFFNTVIALHAGADVELGMMANITSSVPNQEIIKNVLIHFGGTPIEGADQEALFVDELNLDSYDLIEDLTVDFFEAEGMIDEDQQPENIDQVKGVLLAVERFGVRKIENLENTLSQSRANVKTDEEIDQEIRSFLSKFSVNETIRNEQMTFYSKAQRVPCINPLCRYGKVICTACDGEKNVICNRCDGAGVIKQNVEEKHPIQELIECKECGGTGFEPGQVIEVECDCNEKVDCKVCGGKGVIKEDYCHNCEGSGKVCALCGGTGILEITEKGPVCNTCGGAGVIASQPMVTENPSTVSTNCKTCEGTGTINCTTCLGTGNIACESCEGQGHMFRNVKLEVLLDTFPKGEHTTFIQFDDEEMNRIFMSDFAEIINTLRTIEDVKIYRHEDRMVGKLFHKPTNMLLAAVNNFLGEIEAPYNQAYERVELIVAKYHYVTFEYADGSKKRILLLNNNKALSR
ncbi:MAG: hypothetical protein SCL54_04230 [Bacillota bacterium]|nr:hypothetical protein [Bacillota bacterium]